MPTCNNAMLSGIELYPRWVPLFRSLDRWIDGLIDR